MPASYRLFNSPGGQTVNGVSYIYDNDSGVFRPAYKSDFAANISVSGLSVSVGAVAVTGGTINVANTAPIPISGVVQGNFDSNTTNILLSGISGVLSSNLNDPAWVTGNIGINNTAPIPISGVVVAGVSNPIGVTGTRFDVNPVYSGNGVTNYGFVPVGGRAVNVTGAGFATGYQTGDYAILNFDRTNGALIVNQGVLDPTQDCVSIVFSGNSAVSNRAVSGAAQAVLAANSLRQYGFVQNLGTGALMIGLGAAPTTGSLNIILQGGTALNDGKGGKWETERYRGAVYVSGVDFTVSSPYIAWEL